MVTRPRRPTLDSARFGRTPVQFLLVLAACCLVAIVALVIVVAGLMFSLVSSAA